MVKWAGISFMSYFGQSGSKAHEEKMAGQQYRTTNFFNITYGLSFTKRYLN